MASLCAERLLDRELNAAAFVLHGGLAAAGPDKIAVEDDDERLRYRDLLARVARFAAGLQAAGLARGDRVIIAKPDTVDSAALVLAVMAAGGIAVPLSLRAEMADIEHALAIVAPFAVVAGGSALAAFDEALARTGAQTVLYDADSDLAGWKARAETEPRFAPTSPADPAFWLLTSGTTGRPKAVEHRHGNVPYCTDYLFHALGATSDDRFLATSRLNFAYALGTVLFGALRIGATSAFAKEWPTAPAIIAAVERFRPTNVFSVPAFYRKLLEAGIAERPQFHAVRSWVSAGERLPPAIAQAWRQAGCTAILDGMGCSETVYMIFTNTPAACSDGSSGKPVPGTDVRLMARDGRRIDRGGEVGALEVRTGSICSGYRGGAKDGGAHSLTRRLDDGWFATGDDYRMDEAGFFHHCGRSDDMLRVSGLWVSPAEIEDGLSDVDEVAEVAAVQTVADSGLLEITLCVVRAAGCSADAAMTAARRRLDELLPASKRPRRYAVVSELPRTATGKIQRHRLRGLFGSADEVKSPGPTSNLKFVNPAIERSAIMPYAAGLPAPGGPEVVPFEQTERGDHVRRNS
jgi:acyl-coenzyme A synthetase/AMP-(fatty) acid ligase